MESSESDFAFEEFVKARKCHWKLEASILGAEVAISSFGNIRLREDESNFLISAKGPDDLHAVFEDSAETGWFYIFDLSSKCVLKATHVYNRSNVSVESDDVDVAWSVNGEVCCVAVWGQIRAFLGVKREIDMRKPITDREEDGFYASEWPKGFDYLLKKED